MFLFILPAPVTSSCSSGCHTRNISSCHGDYTHPITLTPISAVRLQIGPGANDARVAGMMFHSQPKPQFDLDDARTVTGVLQVGGRIGRWAWQGLALWGNAAAWGSSVGGRVVHGCGKG